MSNAQKFLVNLSKAADTLNRFAGVAMKVHNYKLASELYEQADAVTTAIDYVRKHSSSYESSTEGQKGIFAAIRRILAKERLPQVPLPEIPPQNHY